MATLSYETVMDIYRRETDRRELQKLEPDFFKDLQEYCNSYVDKIKIAQGDERSKLINEFNNVKRTLRSLYDRRERKVVEMAIDKARTKSNIIDASSLLKEERELFDNIVIILDSKRAVFMNTIARGDFDPAKEEAEKKLASENTPNEAKEIQTEQKSECKREELPNLPEMLKEEIKVIENQLPAEKTGSSSNGTKLVRFIRAVPQFLGTELEIYGPFDAEDMANLPAPIADVLIRKNRAEEIEMV